MYQQATAVGLISSREMVDVLELNEEVQMVANRLLDTSIDPSAVGKDDQARLCKRSWLVKRRRMLELAGLVETMSRAWNAVLA